jgi:hypothetical protein
MSLTTKWTSLAMGLVLGASSVGVVTLAVGPSAAGGTAPTYKVSEVYVHVGLGKSVTENLKCPVGMIPVGGGAHFGSGSFTNISPSSGYSVLQSDINLAHNGWETTVDNVASGPSSFTIDAICLKP